MVAPTYRLAAEGWEQPGGILDLARPVCVKVNRAERTCRLANGATIEARSADNEDNLRGAGLDFLGIDEAASIKEAAWLAARPCVSDRLGRVLCAGSPKGKNWWFREWQKGQDAASPDHESWRMPSSVNPEFPAEEWEAAKRSLPPEWFVQEYEADFLATRPAVFTSLEKVLQFPGPWPRVFKGPFVHGIDVGSAHDFTALVTVDIPSGWVVNLVRMRHHPYRVIAQVLAEVIFSDFRGPAWVDATGVGPALVEPLRELGVRVHPVTITSKFKGRAISKLLGGMEGGALSIPRTELFAPLIRELREFEMGYTPEGRVTFAGHGEHDDCVSALMLAWWGTRRGALNREVRYGR